MMSPNRRGPKIFFLETCGGARCVELFALQQGVYEREGPEGSNQDPTLTKIQVQG